MNKHRRNLIGTLATGVVVAGLAMISAGTAAAQTLPDIEAIVRQFHVNYSNGEVEKNGALVDDSLIVQLNGGADNKVNGFTFKGRDQFVAWIKGEKGVFPDGKITDNDVVVSGNMAAIRFTFEGTQTGPMETPNGTLPATGRKVVVQGTEFFTFNSSGKLIHLETLSDDLGLLSQLTAK